jgi:hypothetical protein
MPEQEWTLERIVAEAERGNTKPYIETFLSVRSKEQGIVPFLLNPAQDKFIEEVTNRSIILKARQIGISTIALAHLYVRTITSTATLTVLVGINKEQTKEFLEHIKMFYELTPQEVRPVVENNNMYEFSFPHLRSKILVLSPTKTLGRGLTINYALISELPFWKFADESVTSIEEAVPTGGTIIVEATPLGTGNKYHRMWSGANDPQDWNGYKPITLAAELVYTPEWLAEKRKKIGARRYAQEYGLDFLQSGRPVFADEDLKPHEQRIRERLAAGDKPPPDPTPQPAKPRHYLHGVDVAEGLAKGDFHVHVVFDRDKGEEVFCQRGKWPIDVFAKKVDEIARKYPGIVGVERNNHGHALLLRLRQLGTPGLYRHDDGRDGWITSGKTKTMMIDELEEAVRNESVRIGDLTALEEMRNYQYKDDGGSSAPSGQHDDHVMARAIAWQMRKRNSRPFFLTD